MKYSFILDIKSLSVIVFVLIDFKCVNTILGGREIEITEAPYSVNYGDRCGGVIIGKKWILTAAHCGFHAYVRFGSKYRLKKHKVFIHRHLVHPQFGLDHKYGYDIQLLQISRNLLFSKAVNAIILWGGGAVRNINASGWGFEEEKKDYTKILKQVEMMVVKKSLCQSVDKYWYNYTLTDEMFCAGNSTHDACQGDSGGGATIGRPGHQQLVGIASFGYGCGRVPGVYINISTPAVLNWIQQIAGLDVDINPCIA